MLRGGSQHLAVNCDNVKKCLQCQLASRSLSDVKNAISGLTSTDPSEQGGGLSFVLQGNVDHKNCIVSFRTVTFLFRSDKNGVKFYR